jgi:predicted metal-dependent enzyme (double-stranded beta helix superfamily)
MTQLTYSLAAFTQDLDRLVDEESLDDAELVRRAKPLLEQLLADMSWLDERCTVPRGSGSVQYLVHRHPRNAYTITATVFAEGYSTTVHDHTTWGLIGVWRGEEREERFVRTDDRSDPGHAELRAAGTVLNGPGAVTWLIPPDQEVHRIRNLSPFPSLSIHVYGDDLDGKPRHQFNLETGEIKEFKTTAVVIE